MKNVSLSDAAAAALLGSAGQNGEDSTEEHVSPVELKRRVAWVNRSISLRATAASVMPYALIHNGKDLDRTSDLARDWALILRRILKQTEADLCVTGSAYWLVTPNQYGYNFHPRRLVPRTVKAKYDKDGVLTGFVRTLKGRETNFPDYQNREQGKPFILHFWLDNADAETGPGDPPLQAALFDAETVYNMGRHQRRYWENGAIANTVFFMAGGSGSSSGLQATPSDKDLNNMAAAWKRVTKGVRNAFETIFSRYSMVPHKVGTDPKDLAAKELSDLAVSAIAAAFGIPESLLKSLSATYAGALVDDWHFTSKTVHPHLESIYSEPLNLFFSLVGLRFEWRPEEHQSFQAYQNEEARTVGELVQQGVMGKGEGRMRVGLSETEPDTPDKRHGDMLEKLEVVQKAVAAGIPVEWALDLVDLPGVTWDDPQRTDPAVIAIYRRAQAQAERLRGNNELQDRKPATDNQRDQPVAA